MSSREVQTGFPIAGGDVAIIGMACIFPGAPDLDTFWQNIVSKVDAITDVPSDRWDPEIFFNPDSTENDRVYCKRGGYLRELAQFNPSEYGIMPVAVDGGDPSQFLALKVAYQALADAGYLERLENRERMEIILGRGNYLDRGISTAAQHSRAIEQTLQILKNLHPEYTHEELQRIKKELKASLPNFGPDNAPSLIPNITTGRIANRLDFMGPNFTVDAACASSLIATELAMHDLLSRKCDLVLAGGVFILPDVPFSIIFCQLRALSQQSQIRPFDKNADGTIIGEGIGIFVLKRLEDAERDSDTIYAVIKGVGTSSDGRAFSVTAPRVEGAELALRRAYEMSGISSQTIELMEAHGTGTPAGDAAEIEALSRVFGTRGECYPWCALGTIKSMIGHTMPAAGAAGLIKAALALYHKVLPPTLHCDEPHPKLEETAFYINSETRPWIHGSPETPRRAGINAFGFGGVNAHIILEEYTNANEANAPSHLLHWETEVCILQAESRQSLIERTQQLEQFLEINPGVPLKDLAYTLNTALDEALYRLAVVASSPEDFQQKLQHVLRRLSDPQCTQIKDIKGIYFFERPLSRDSKLAFLFPGEGSQYVGMLSDLCIHFPEVRACFDELDAAFIDRQRGYLPSQVIFPPPTFSKGGYSQVDNGIWQMEGAIVAVFTANKALFTLLTRLELQPDVIVGHSTGELSAILASEMTEMNPRRLRVLSSIYERLVAEGGIPEANMVAVGSKYALISAIVDKIGGNICIAMDNCPHQVVVVGEQHAIEQAIDEFQSRGLIYEKLPFSRAYHTPLFGAVCESFRQFFSEQPVYAPKIEIWSCTTMQPYPKDVAEIHKLAVDHWVHPVRFRETIEAMYGAGVRLFVEVGPRGNLTAFVDDILRGQPHLAVASNVARRSGITQLNHLVGLLAAQGIPMRLDYLYARRAPQRLSLDEAYITDTKDVSASMTLSLGFPSMGVSPRKPPSEKGEDIKPRQSMLSAQSPAIPQEPKDASALETSQGFEGAVPESDTVEAEGEVTGVSSQAMKDYLQTMEHFLEVQQHVMEAYLTRGRAVLEQGQRLVDQPIAGQTQQRTDMEGPPASPFLKIEGRQPSEIADMSTQSLTQVVLNLVSERTGYPPEMLDLNLDMEADLGIDSIKRIEILGAFQEQHASLQKEVDMEQIANLKTLQQVIDFLEEQFGASEITPGMPIPSTPGKLKVSGIGTSAPEEHPQSKVSGTGAEAQPLPFIDTIISHVPGQELVARHQIDLREDVFLQDHAFGSQVSVTDDTLRPLCVIPMTISMEMMAEAAAKLLPGKSLIGMRDIRAHRWILVDEKPKTLEIVARKQTSDTQEEVAVRIWDMGDGMEPGSSQGSAIIEGTMVFGDAYPQPPSAEAFSLRAERTPKHTAEEIYREKLMFHGPRFQGVVLLERLGEDGVLGQIEALPNTNLFLSNPDPSLIIDPFLIDAVGQLVGYWPLEYLESDFIAFPIRLKELHLYGPNPHPSERLTCQVRIRQVTSKRLRADIDVTGPDGQLRMRLIGWEDWRFYWTSEFFNFSRHPKSVALSVPWDTPISKFPVPESFECYRLNILGAEQTALKDLWVHAILNRQERETWRNLRGTEARQSKWLAGKLVAKDAVRMFLKKHHGIELCPADIDIATDEHGGPVPQGAWTRDVEAIPAVSLAHTDGLAVAVVGYCSNDQRVGIDVERIREYKPGFDNVAFVPEEQSLLLSLGESTRQEWMTRFWCAKEAVAKALGHGLIEGPQSLAVQALNGQTGVIYVSLRGKLAEMFPELASAQIVAYTACEDDYIVASTLCERV